MSCCDTDEPHKHLKLGPVTDAPQNRHGSLWKRAGQTHVHIWCVHVAARSCVFMCWYVCTFPMFTRPPPPQETHVFSWQGRGERAGSNSCTKETKKKLVCCCRLAREAQLRGRRGRTWRSTRFLFARWRESVEGTCAVNGECVWVQVCECFKKWNPQGGIFVRLDNEQNEQPSWVCEDDD